jgi:UPF0716 protein FxsA
MLAALLAAVVALAALEIFVIILVAHAIGLPLTLLALLASTVAGLWLVRGQRRRSWGALQAAAADGAVPGRELGDAMLVLIGGALIAVPGFVTDALGVLAAAPLTRPLLRRLLGAVLLRRAVAVTSGRRPPGRGRPRGGAQAADAGAPVIKGEVLKEEDTGPPHGAGGGGQPGDRG